MDNTVVFCDSLSARVTDPSTHQTAPATELVQRLKETRDYECYELLKNDAWIRPYFDLDISEGVVGKELFESKKSDTNDLVERHINYIRGWMPGADVAVASCHRKDKLSYHFVVTNYKTKMESMYALAQTFKEIGSDFDPAPYNKTANCAPRKFRTVFAVKGGDKPAPALVPESHQDSLENHFITIPHTDSDEFVFYGTPKMKPPPTPTVIEIDNTPPSSSGGLGSVMVNDDRVTYKEWIKIGVSMLRVMPENEARLEFEAYSKRHPSYDRKTFYKIYNDLVQRRYKNGGWGLLRKWTPIEYHSTHIRDTPFPTSGTDYDYAEYIYKEYDGPSVCCFRPSETKNILTWFIFKDHRWQKVDESFIIREMFDKFLYPRFEDKIQRTKETLEAIGQDDDKSKTLEKTMEKMRKNFDRVKDMPKTRSVLARTSCRFTDPDFREKIDQQAHLIGFHNGVYDLDAGEFEKAGKRTIL
jgi:hypothetical protein